MKYRFRTVLVSLAALLAAGSFQAVAATAASAQPHFEEFLPQAFVFNGGVATLETAHYSVQCKTVTGGTEMSGWSTLDGQLKFHNCTGIIAGIPAGSCESSGAGSGEVVTSTLIDNLVYLSSAKHEAGMLFAPLKAGAAFATLHCQGFEMELKGSILAKITPVNVRTKSFQLAAKGSKGTQELTTYEGSKGEKLTSGLELSANKGASFEKADLNAIGFELQDDVEVAIKA